MFKGVCLSVFVVVVSNSSLSCIGKAVSPFHYVFIVQVLRKVM